jgi:HTH-type transcriptional regulator / antitoxin HigA
VQIINKVRLHDFWAGHERAEMALRAWAQLVSGYDWESAESLKATFPAAHFHEDLVAFDLHGSSYFVVVAHDFQRGKLWVRDVLMHSDVRSDQWKSIAATDEPLGRSFDDLMNEFPLRPIRDSDQLRQAMQRADALLVRTNRSLDEQDYLDVLSLLIAEYEHQHVVVPPVSGGDIVRLLISEHRLSQVEIIPLLGGKEKSLALLKGARPLDLRQATRAARYFKLPVETFMDPDDLEIEIPKPSRRRR